MLLTDRTSTAFGYRLVGAKPGPQVVVAGICPAAEGVFERLLSIPTLRWMRGNLVVVRLDVLDDLVQDISSLAPLGVVDRTVVLPVADTEEGNALRVGRNYHLVLRTCTELGMIAGRGVGRGLTES